MKVSKDLMKSKKEAVIPMHMRFVLGGASAMMATSIIQPFDLIKTRLQNITESRRNVGLMGVARMVVREEGLLGFYNGLSAALLRQATYGTTRLGTYTYLFEYFSKEDSPLSLVTKILLGMTAGGCGAVVGTPTEVALIRMTSDGALPADKRRNYRNVFDAISRIVTEEGPKTLMRGVVPTVARAMVVNAAQLASYSQAKEAIMPYLAQGHHEDLRLHLLASLVSGLVTTVCSLPVDLTKTRIQNMPMSGNVNPVQVILQVVRQEGLLKMWRGFLPYYLRCAPHTVFTFVFLEQLNAFYLQTMFESDYDEGTRGL